MNNSSAEAPIATAGAAADDVAVASVRVAIRDNATLLWWNGTGWGAAGSYVQAALDSPGGSTTGWSYPFAPGMAGNFGIQVKAVDSSGNVGPNTTWRNFTITVPGSDTTGPTTALTTPTNGQASPFGPVSVTGTSSDATAVASVRVSIQNTATSQWWNGSALGGGDHVRQRHARHARRDEHRVLLHVRPGHRGERSPSRSAGSIRSANLGNTVGPRPFSIFVDTTAPVTTVATPTNNSTNTSPVVMSGTATDNVGVTVVRVSIKNAVRPMVERVGDGARSRS